MAPNPQTPPSSAAACPPENDIPPLTTLLPAVFVPVPASFFAYTPPATREAQIRETVAALETHAARVRANILALTRQECRRIARDAEIQESRLAGQPQQPRPSRAVSAADKAAMLANMQAGAEAGADRPLSQTPDFSDWLVSSPREWRDREVLRTVARTMADLKGFREHVARQRARYEEALEREMREERDGGEQRQQEQVAEELRKEK
ncbi:uncharacterized protein MAM_00958 [Metarhizium album ARSEF 1941]|uniref:Uncharacterized protein n=1 Tax=Metarhizium album (strain ARSEF 1941) TaxID=1081103 RepID=A0A0B2X094_METAS|nr:uncharacterized protein MAM_00958 [Metarhizium album ARSEF 1941]KHO01957.1 hypothetical protein MAM_00958 [Metarhizium album ARSEF 1941]